MKSAYEKALEKMEAADIDRPRREALSDEQRERMAEVRRRAEAQLAELEIMFHEKQGSLADPVAQEKAEAEYRDDRRRAEERRERELGKIRSED